MVIDDSLAGLQGCCAIWEIIAGKMNFQNRTGQLWISSEVSTQFRSTLAGFKKMHNHPINMDEAIATVAKIAAEYSKEETRAAAEALGIDVAALTLLDQADPPIPYPLYFCTPADLIEHPRLVMYYRNVAMLTRKAMNVIGLGTEAYELGLVAPPPGIAAELAHYFNRIVAEIIKVVGVTPRRHIESAFANLGETLQFDQDHREPCGTANVSR